MKRDILSLIIKRNGVKEFKAKGTVKDIETEWETWMIKEMGERRIKWRK